MKKYDDIVIGSGISGLTAALLLAQNGRKVLLLEKSSTLGGSLTRFYRDGIPFDVGFHFTGGLANGEILSSMLTALGIRDSIEPVFLSSGANTAIFEESNKRFDMPAGIQDFGRNLKVNFPGDADAIDAYTFFMQKMYDEIVTLNLKDTVQLFKRVDEDYVTLGDMLNKLADNSSLKIILASFCLCYGTEPSEISYANHARISAALYESIARVENGGDSFINAFKDQFEVFNVDVSTDTYIEKLLSFEGKRAKGCVLNTGEKVCADNYIFAIHPKEILKTLPREHLSEGFVSRVSDFEESFGFFFLSCVLEDIDSAFKPGIVTLFPNFDLECLSGTGNPDKRAITFFKNIAFGRNGKRYFVLNILEPSFLKDVEEWTVTNQKNRPQEYLLYKKQRTEKILRRLFKSFPEYKNRLRVLDSASMLTFRDYLHSFDGSAYGVKQKIGQFNLFGRLPIRNVYAIGQSAVLPGVLGAMLSSFILGRTLLGEEVYNEYVKGNRKVSKEGAERARKNV